mmetsp:Transcript_35303/g.42578  ORF Transcript_35303/g.42578 Transcript_35303/m.42578 type:complete len:97 (+) Transcript_35303:165-455(+)|eukprot:CAMPEP_0194391186 /NCGR_PEP_ID=MMETSP0174-20130528/114285_1 /TAXON_ID=216777 /ORGANISM="Proboscia alata, Strain PI-D3" /LENGTH=96 /DNA_ID=CAMNT_0039185287 /DNA_START=1069 /DNA_END=1359 /DNA_ORIENTATION=-
MTVGIPSGCAFRGGTISKQTFQKQPSGAGVDVSIVNGAGKSDERPRVEIVVFRGQLDFEFEDCVFKGTPSDKDHSVEYSDIVVAGEDVDTLGCVVF